MRYRPRRSVVAALAASTLLALTGCDSTPAGGVPHSEPAPVVVETIDLEPTSIPLLLSAVGAFESPQTTLIASEVGGVVTFLDIPEGAEVEQGRLLARVDSRQAAAQLSVARARYRNAKETFDRVASLHRDGLISKQELDDAASTLDQEAGALERSKTSLNQTEVRAPFTGQLGLREVSLGAYVEAGDTLVRLTQTDPLRLVFSIPERDSSLLRTGQKIRGIAGDCTKRFEAEIAVIDPSIDAATRTVRARALVANGDRALRAGMSGRLEVEVGRNDRALTVPLQAVVRRGTTTSLHVVTDGGTIEEREVGLGRHYADRVEVRSGVEAGSTIVVAGYQRIRSGAVADPRPYEAVTNPKLVLGFPHIPACEL